MNERTSKQRQVHFFCVGPQRTSSSWLHEVLSCHPEIEFPEGVKETKFFDRYHAKGLDWYLWHFRSAKPDSISGEIAPSYFDNEDAATKIAGVFPNAKIIINVRNPIEQSHSLFRHHYSKGRVSADFFRATEKLPRIITAGRYANHAPTWERLFPGQVLYVNQEATRTAAQQTLDQVCRFVGVEPIDLPAVGKEIVNSAEAPRSRAVARAMSGLASVNRGLRMHWAVELGKQLGLKSVFRGGRPVNPIDDELHAFLLQQFERDIEWLEGRLQRKFPHWRTNQAKQKLTT